MMKKLLTMFMAVALSAAVFGQKAGDLFFSEYVEGSSNNKAIEIYNGTGAAVDLSVYTVKLWSNGATSAGTDWGNNIALTGSIAAGDVYVIYNASAGTGITTVGDISSNVTFFNGNDVVGLFKNGTLIDVIGNTAEYLATAWDVAGVTEATLDHTLVRKNSVTAGNTNWNASRGTTADNSEWIVFDKDDFTHLGWHINQQASNATDILTFVVSGQQGSSVVDATAHTVDFDMPVGTNLTAIAPAITLSTGATISPASGVAQNFSSAVVYTVTAEDATTTQTWTVTAHLVDPIVTLFEDNFEAGNLNKWTAVSVKGDQVWSVDITHGVDGSKCGKMSGYSGGSFENEDWLISPVMDFSNVTDAIFSFYSACNYTGADIAVKYSTNYSGSGAPSAATWTDLTATLSAGTWAWTPSGDISLSTVNSATVSIAIVYTSTAAESKTWEVDNVIVKATPVITLNTETDITAFSFAEQFAPATIDATNHKVNVQVVYGTALTSLVPTIVLSEGATISPASGVAHDFSAPVVYTVTAEDVTYTQDWTVTVTVAAELSHAAEMLTFALAEEVFPAVINADDTTVTCTVAQLEDLTSLTPAFTYSQGAQVSPSVASDFSSPVTFKITAQDGTTVKNWVVTVEKASNEAAITGFTLAGMSGDATINAEAHTVKANVETGTDLTAVEPAFTLSAGATISPEGAQNLSSPKVYTVTSEDGTVNIDWTVTISVLPAGLVSIYDIQYTTDASGDSPKKDQIVRTQGVVTGVDAKGYFIQDGIEGWNGVYVFVNAQPEVVIGNKVELQGLVVEYSKLTEIKNVSSTVIEAQVSVPAPIDVNVNSIKDEQYEGMLMKLAGPLTVKTATNGGKNWTVENDGGDTLQLRNQIFVYESQVGEEFASITGILNQYNAAYQLLPRSADDLVVGINENAFTQFAIWPNPANNVIYMTGTDNVSKMVVSNLMGQVISETNQITGEMVISNLHKGIYLITIFDNQGNYMSVKFVKE